MRRVLSILGLCASALPAPATDRKDTMCVKQKDGAYKCKASGKIEKEPYCDTPSNKPISPTPKPHK